MQTPRPGSPTLSSPMNADWRTRLPFFYGWVVVGSVFVVMAIIYGIFYSFSIFYVALLADFGWSRAAAAGVMSVCAACHALAGAGAGALIDRFGPSRVVPAGGLLTVVGLFATSQITELWQFYLFFGVLCGIGMATAGWVPGVIIVSRWFSGKRGLAVGIASAGIGLGLVLFAPLSQYIISTAGWRTAYVVMGFLTLILVAPQTAFLLLGKPEELGLKPDGVKGTEARQDSAARRPTRVLQVVDKEWASRNWSVASAAGTFRLWAIIIGYFLNVTTSQLLWVHQTPYLVDGGFDRMLAASAMGLAGFLSIPFKILWGEASDRLGRERTFALGMGAAVLSMGMLVMLRAAPFTWMVIATTVVFAAGYAVGPPVVSAISSDIFVGRNFGSIYGVICIGQGMGSAFGSWLGGYVFDSTGSYLAAFAIGAGAAVLSGICMWLAAPRLVRRMVFLSRSEAHSS